MASNLVRVWQSAIFQEPNVDRVLSFDTTVINALHPQEFWTLVQMYSHHLREPCILALDREENIVRLGTAKYLSQFKPMFSSGYMMPELALPFVLPPAQAAARSQIMIAGLPGPNKIPRPRNAFIIYRMSKRVAVRTANPGAHNNDISIIIGKMWQRESSEVRNNFKKLAEDEKKLHLQLYPNYRYQPRKPSEKKRRISKKANAIVSQQSGTNYSNTANDTGNLCGDTGEILTATLPLSSNGLMSIAEHNHNIQHAQKVFGFDFSPSQEYADAQESDLRLIGEHFGREFSHDDPSPTNILHLGEAANGFDFALHACDFPEYEAELVAYLKTRT